MRSQAPVNKGNVQNIVNAAVLSAGLAATEVEAAPMIDPPKTALVLQFADRQPGNNAAERRLLAILKLPQGFGVGLDVEDLLDDLILLAFDRQAESRTPPKR